MTEAWNAEDRQHLSPCPFCGMAPVTMQRWVDRGSGDSANWFAIDCDRHKGMMIRAAAYGPHGYKRDDDPPSDAAAREIVRALWNARPETQAPEVLTGRIEEPVAGEYVEFTLSNKHHDHPPAQGVSLRLSAGGIDDYFRVSHEPIAVQGGWKIRAVRLDPSDEEAGVP